MTRRNPPRTRRALEDRIRNLAREGDGRGLDANTLARRRSLAVANVIVGRLLPDAVVKGGTALQFRFGALRTRFTEDLDAARRRGLSVDEFVDDLTDRLDEGWAGFTGTVAEHGVASPPGIPDAYVMRPFRVALSYQRSSWITVTLELGHDEIGSTENPELVESSDASAAFAALGLPDPGHLRVLSTAHQIAQKLHACTRPPDGRPNDRARDLVDLQLLGIPDDLPGAATIARRLFVARREHAWPPTVVARPGWGALYTEASRGLDVVQSVDEAVAWANVLVRRLDAGI